MSAAIDTYGVGIRFLFDRQRRLVTPVSARLRHRVSSVTALRDVTFTIRAGESVALLGWSGAGKTTLLRLLAGVLYPDEGRVDVRGRVASLLSVEGGLMPLLTGRENAILLGVLAGLSRAESKESLDEVKRRSGLGEAFDRPVSSYSQGMKARLGLAVTERVQPEILLLDEVHEALDHDYRLILERRAGAMLSTGGIVVAAGHDHPLLERLGQRGVLLENGAVAADGDFRAVRERFLAARKDSPG